MKNIYRHGDLIFTPLKKLPKNIIQETLTKNSFVLALGEVTGHKHVMTAQKEGDLNIFKDSQGRYVIEVVKPTVLTHEEHKALQFEPGFYLMDIEREHDYMSESIRKVLD